MIGCRREQYAPNSDSKHLNMINEQLRSTIVIMNMENNVRQIEQIRHEFNKLHLFTIL